MTRAQARSSRIVRHDRRGHAAAHWVRDCKNKTYTGLFSRQSAWAELRPFRWFGQAGKRDTAFDRTGGTGPNRRGPPDG